MGEQHGLTEENVEDLTAQPEETQKDAPDTISMVRDLVDKVDGISRKLDLVFDGLATGVFKKV